MKRDKVENKKEKKSGKNYVKLEWEKNLMKAFDVVLRWKKNFTNKKFLKTEFIIIKKNLNYIL